MTAQRNASAVARMERSEIGARRCHWQGCPRIRRPRAVTRCRLRALTQLPNLRLQQRPALRPELLLPCRVDVGKPDAERRLVHLVEDEARSRELVAEAGVDSALVDALLAHVFGDVAADRVL